MPGNDHLVIAHIQLTVTAIPSDGSEAAAA
jgi:hypothetical protein